jgi:hypothetical protein
MGVDDDVGELIVSCDSLDEGREEEEAGRVDVEC